MSLLCTRLVALLACVIVAVVSANDEISGELVEQKLQIHPAGLEGDKYVVKANKAFRIACVYNDEDMENVHQLQWVNEDGKEIDTASSPNLFTIALHERGTHHKKRSLVFSKINSRDSGTYTCVANVNGEVTRRSIHVHIVGNIEWNEPRDVVGAMVGEPLTIDCGAKGNPSPEIEMTNEEGELLNDLADTYVVVDNEVTIDHLSKEYQNNKVRCLALQHIAEYATTSVEKHEITIDVWYEPEFETKEVNRHAIMGRSANIYCNVSSSNPPVSHFHFFKGTDEIDRDDETYEIIEDFESQTAVLKILSVDEEDLGTYRCEVNNGKAKSHQQIHLHTANPPNQVRVSLERARKHSITWRLVEDGSAEDEDLPVISYTIEYVRSQLLDDVDSSEEEPALNNEKLHRAEESVWKSHGSHVVRTKNPENLYEITGLVQNAEYVFRFSAQNEAGSGDSIEITARTHSEHHEELTAFSTCNIPSITLMLFLTWFFFRI
uniref:Fibronectin type III domain protein n=1 Tax=Panagrellus redivivus TaxID=6233 RepID=A0A7E4VGR6_PANRE